MCIEYPYTYKSEEVVLTGAARQGRAGVPMNPVTVTISDICFKYKVVLPAVARSLCDLSIDVLPNGDVEVEGTVSAGEVISSVAPIVCNRRTRRIFPEGHFTINFTLPGPADPTFVTAKLLTNGVLEGAVLKQGIAKRNPSSD